MTLTPQEVQDSHHPFTVLANVQPIQEGKLSGYTVSLKDALWVQDVESTASSAILKGFKPVEHATVASKILHAGGHIIGKTVQDEFGFGSFATNVGVGYTIPLHPLDKERVTGGSSGGAAVAAALLPKHLAVAESTGGSIVTPASFCGVVGICPTYGRVSRYGLISYASSLDKVGTMASSVEDAALLLEVISGHDTRDETSSELKPSSYSEHVKLAKKSSLNGLEFAYIDFPDVDPKIKETVEAYLDKLHDIGVHVHKMTLPYTQEYALAAYYTIAMSEASTHLACLSGLRYGAGEPLEGTYDEYFSKVRSTYFGKEAKRRLLLGTFMRMTGYRGKFYTKALQVRAKVIQEYKEVFRKYPVIITPTTPFLAPRFDEVDKLSPAQVYVSDFLTVGPNLAGLPHITVPIQKKGALPVGLMLTGDHFTEEQLVATARVVEMLR